MKTLNIAALIIALTSMSSTSEAQQLTSGVQQCPAYSSATLELRSAYFETAEEAALDAVNTFNPRSIDEDREFIGTIVETRHGYQYSVHAGDIHDDEVKATVRVAHSERLVAMWHTHGAHGRGRHIFSPTDHALVEQLDVPFYMASSRGELRRLDPDAPTIRPTMTKAMGLGYIKNAAFGEVVSEEDSIDTDLGASYCSEQVASMRF